MLSVPDLAFAGLLLVCFVLVLRWSTAPTFRFSPALLFFVLFVLQQAIGCMALVREDDPRDVLGRTGLQLGILGFTLGVGILTVWSRFRPGEELGMIRRRISLPEPDLRQKLLVMTVGYVLCVGIVFTYFQSGGGLPLFDGIGAFLSGDEALAAQQLLKQRRMEMTYFETSSYRGQGYVDQLRMVILPYVFACFMIWALASKRRRNVLLVSVSGLPIVLFLMGTGQRHPTLSFLMAMTILAYVMSRPEKHKKLMAVFFVAGVLVFFVLTYLLGRYSHKDSFGSDMGMVALGLWNRIVYSNATGTLALFHLFPNPEPFRFGSTWIQDLQGFLPGPYVAFSAWLFRRLYGFVGTAAPMCFGEMFANFGLAGVFFGGALVGVTLQGVQVVWARRKRYRAEDLVLYAMGSMSLSRWAMGGLLTPIQFGLVALPLLYVAIRAGTLGIRFWTASCRHAVRFPRDLERSNDSFWTDRIETSPETKKTW